MNVGWIVLILFVCTIAELIISPVGISLATKLAPKAHRVNMMALYFTSVGNGYQCCRVVGSVLQHGNRSSLLHPGWVLSPSRPVCCCSWYAVCSEDDARREVATKLLIYTANLAASGQREREDGGPRTLNYQGFKPLLLRPGTCSSVCPGVCSVRRSPECRRGFEEAFGAFPNETIRVDFH